MTLILSAYAQDVEASAAASRLAAGASPSTKDNDMRHLASRFVSGTASLFGTALTGASLVGKSHAGTAPALVLGLALMIFFAPRWYRLYRFRTHTFFWYRKKHPGLVSDAGTITCDRCSSKHLSVHALRRAPGTRAHFCKTCGKTLYFSAEGC
ncbi:hypothetical protein [Ralstonia pickettii]|uniref:hypothetical protein n=1 Tax=Ralstonia pickettii TaxID=329 RepID=UPI0021759EFD|nr:hypothetical protein [Ralstonia pickettii]